MGYISAQQAATKWGISKRRVKCFVLKIELRMQLVSKYVGGARGCFEAGRRSSSNSPYS